MYIWIFFVFLILSPIMLVSLTLSLLLFLNTLLHVFSNKNCRLHSRPAWERERERDGQRFIDMSFQSTVYPSEEMYLCTVGGISICCKISRNNTAWSPQYCTVFSLADLFALFLSHTCTYKKQSCQQDPSPFISIPLNLTNMKHLI